MHSGDRQEYPITLTPEVRQLPRAHNIDGDDRILLAHNTPSNEDVTCTIMCNYTNMHVFVQVIYPEARPFRPESEEPYSTSSHVGERAKAAWISPTCEYVCGKLPHMQRLFGS